MITILEVVIVFLTLTTGAVALLLNNAPEGEEIEGIGYCQKEKRG